jgi:nicotinate-nucleotide adenylyltransferase
MGRVIGVFGGTFDPPHLGHLILAEHALDEFDLEAVLWVLTPRSPLKPEGRPAPVPARLRLVRAAIDSNPRFRLSTVDIDREPPYFAVGTLERLRADEPQADLIYLIGSDALQELPRWHEPQRLVALCAAIGVMDRPGHEPDLDGIDGQVPGLAAKVWPFRVPRVEISASDIRRRVSEGRSIRYLVPEAVRQLIEQEGLYRPEGAV